MARNIQVVNVRDFTGGLNLNPNVMQLGENESPSLSNVDVSERGGFRLRKGVGTYADSPAAGVLSIHALNLASGSQQILVATGANLRYTTGSSWTTIGARTLAQTSIMFKGKMYLSDGTNVCWRWDGSTKTNMAEAFNDNLALPAGGNFPKAKFSTVYKGSVFIANTVEGGVSYPNRVRWSHPNSAEDWVSYHYVDVDPGADGDEITAIIPFDDRLVVFKRKSIHVVFGDPPEGLSTFPVSHEVGAISQKAVAASESGIYFFDWPGGVFKFNGRSIEWVFERLQPIIRDGHLNASAHREIALGFGNRRLWVSVPTDGATAPDKVFVMSPQLGKDGSWVEYDLAVGPYLMWTPAQGAESLFLAAQAGVTGKLLKLDQPTSTDDFGSGAVHIDSHYQSAWFDLKQPAQKKRWRRPEAVLMDGQDSEIRCDVMKDYDPNNVARQITFRTSASTSTTMVWGPGYGAWGEAWGGAEDEAWIVDRSSPMGSARAVSLRFRGPQTDVDYGINSISLKVTPRRIRS